MHWKFICKYFDSEKRRIEGTTEKPEEIKEIAKKPTEAEDTKIHKDTEDQSDGGPKETTELPQLSKVVTKSDIAQMEAESDENGSTPSDGIRPRKPLHLTD